jgi:chromate reductase, NAD(P)H dehydrogenase (quinone)
MASGTKMKIVSFAGALRKGSVSKQLVQEANRFLIDTYGLTPDYIDLKEFEFPVYDADTEQSLGIPSSILKLGTRIAAADALVIASPEYNGGISSVLKTLVDWLSRLKPMPLADKFLLLVGTSPSGSGGVLGLWHSRAPFESLGVHVFPQMVAIPRSHNAFDAQGMLTDEKSRRKLHEVLISFVRHVDNHHPLPQKGAAAVVHHI